MMIATDDLPYMHVLTTALSTRSAARPGAPAWAARPCARWSPSCSGCRPSYGSPSCCSRSQASSLSQAPFHRLPFPGSFGSPSCCSRSQASSTPARARSTIHGAGASGRTRGSLPRSSSCSGTRPSYGAPRGVRRVTIRCNTRGSRSRSMRSSPWRNSGQDTSNRWTRRRGVRTRRSCSSCAAGAPSDAIRRSMQRP